MMGLLDDTLGFLKTPEGLGVLSGLAGWAAGARHNTPWNNVGRGGLAGLMGYNQAQEEQRRNELADVHMRQLNSQLDDQNRVREFWANGASKFMQTPEQQALANGAGPTVENAAKISQMPGGLDVNGMYRAMLTSGSPSLAQMGMTGLTKKEEPITLAEGAALITPSGKELARNYSGKPINGYLVPDGKGGYTVDPTLFEAERVLKATGRTQVNVPVSVNTEKSYAGEVAQGLAKNDVSALEAAQTAPERILNARRVKTLLTQNPITGTGAEARLTLNKALSTAGFIDGDRVKATEDLASILANQTLDAIRTSGLGAGQGFTDKDRMFLERAKSGNIEINAQTLGTLADMNERAGVATINRGKEIAGRLKGSPVMGSVGQQFNFSIPPMSLPVGKDGTVSAKDLRTGVVYETPKGVAKWNGLMFVPEGN